MNSIYRIIQNDDGIKKIIGHFNSKVIASVVLCQLNHRKNSKMKYMKNHNVDSKYDPFIGMREYILDEVKYNDSSFQDVIRNESTLSMLKKNIYSRR